MLVLANGVIFLVFFFFNLCILHILLFEGERKPCNVLAYFQTWVPTASRAVACSRVDLCGCHWLQHSSDQVSFPVPCSSLHACATRKHEAQEAAEHLADPPHDSVPANSGKNLVLFLD